MSKQNGASKGRRISVRQMQIIVAILAIVLATTIHAGDRPGVYVSMGGYGIGVRRDDPWAGFHGAKPIDGPWHVGLWDKNDIQLGVMVRHGLVYFVAGGRRGVF